MENDLYKILGIHPDSNEEEIREAYRRKAHKHHPDKGGDRLKFIEVQNAYNILSDPQKKKEYDDFTYKKQKGAQKETIKKEPENTTSPKSYATKATTTKQHPSFIKKFAKAFAIVVVLSIIYGIIVDSLNNSNNNLVSLESNKIKLTDNNTIHIATNTVQQLDLTVTNNNKPTSTPKKIVTKKNPTPPTSAEEQIVVPTPPAKTNEEICQDMNGPFGTYDSSNNTCGCVEGYTLGAISKQCITLIASRDESCASSYPGTSFLKYDQTSGKNICDCIPGYYWNGNRTACVSKESLNESCVNSYGSGSYSTLTIKDGKNICDCSYGYTWNIDRSSCVTKSSIDYLCVRDVGRNSYYLGTVTNGKYDCSQPY